MNKLFATLFCTAALFSLSSCDATDNNAAEPKFELEAGSYLYTLNNGNFGANNTSISAYNFDTKNSVADLFSASNGKGLGDTAQDILVLDNQIFTSVYNSGVIFITDLKGAIIKEIKHETYTAPRCFATDGESVFVSYYDGGIAKINPETFEMTSQEANINPDQLVVADDKLYVTVSQGYGNTNACNTIDVYNAETLAFEKAIEVVLNPTQIVADELGNLFVTSMGNYGGGNPAIYQTLQKINIASGEVTELTIAEGKTPIAIAMGTDNTLYVAEGGYDVNLGANVGMIYTYNTESGDVAEFIADGKSVECAYSLSVDNENGEVYLGISDYKNTGDVLIYNTEGELKQTVAAGLNPLKCVRVEISEE